MLGLFLYGGNMVAENNTAIQREIDLKLLKSLRKLSLNSDFRFVIAHIMLTAGIERGFPPDENLPFNEGRRSVGLEIARWFDSMDDGRGDILWGNKIRQIACNEHKLAEYHAMELVEKQRQERK